MYKYIYKYREDLELYDKLVRVHLILNNISLTEQQVNILIYFCKFGINQKTYDKLILNKVVTSNQIINNAKTKLNKLDLINMISYKNWNVHDKLKIKILNELRVMVLCKI
jgi:hypothetical protein